MIEFHKIWIEQCEAARRIKDEYGTEKAPGYLIGEKPSCFVREAGTRPEFQQELFGFLGRNAQDIDELSDSMVC